MSGVTNMNEPEVLRILMLASLFGFSQIAAVNVTTVTTSRSTASTSTLRPTTSLQPTTTTTIKNNASTSAPKTSPSLSSSTESTSVRPTTTWSLAETTTLSLTSTPSSPPWTNLTKQTKPRDMAVVVAIPCVIGFIVLVVVVIVIIFLVVRNKKKRERKRLSGRQTAFRSNCDDIEMQEADPDPQSFGKLGNKATTAGQHLDRNDIYSNTIEVDIVNEPTWNPASRASGKRLDFPPREGEIYANQSELVGDGRRPDSSYLNADDIKRLGKPVSHSRNPGGPGRQEVHKVKMEVPWRKPEVDEGDLYLNHIEVNRQTPCRTAPKPPPTAYTDERWDDESGDSVYANQVEMRGREGWTSARPESTDSSNYLDEKDIEMLRNAKLSSIYAPRYNAAPRN